MVQAGGKVPLVVSTNKGPQGVPGALGPSFNPGRTLFVAESWPLGSDPAIYFTTIQSAIGQAGTMAPTRVDPIGILIFPGTYNNDIVLISNVHLFGMTARGIRVTGNIEWTPGAGVNAAYAAAREDIGVHSLRLIGSTILYDATAKTGDISSLDIRNCSVPDVLTFIARPGTRQDFVQTFDSFAGTILASGQGVIDSYTTEWGLGGSNSIIQDTIFCSFIACQFFDNVLLQDSVNAFFVGTVLYYNLLFSDDCFVVCPGSEIGGSIDMSLSNVGSILDCRKCVFEQSTLIGGAGYFDRDVINMEFLGSVIGANAVTISPPLSAIVKYNVSVTQKGGIPTPITVTNKLESGFDLNDAVGGNDFDITVVEV